MLPICFTYTADTSDNIRGDQSGPLYVGAGVGGGVGIVVVFVAIIVIFVCYKQSKKRKQM